MNTVSGIVPQANPADAAAAEGITQEDGSWLLKDEEEDEDAQVVTSTSGGFSTVKTPVSTPAVAEKEESPEKPPLPTAQEELTDETPGDLAEDYPEIAADSKTSLDAAARTTSSARMEAQKEGNKSSFLTRFFGKKN